MILTAVLMPASEGGYTALNPETGTTTEGESIEEAIANLREATELYLEEFPLGSVGQPVLHSKSRSMPKLPRVSGAEVVRALTLRVRGGAPTWQSFRAATWFDRVCGAQSPRAENRHSRRGAQAGWCIRRRFYECIVG